MEDELIILFVFIGIISLAVIIYALYCITKIKNNSEEIKNFLTSSDKSDNKPKKKVISDKSEDGEVPSYEDIYTDKN